MHKHVIDEMAGGVSEVRAGHKHRPTDAQSRDCCASQGGPEAPTDGGSAHAQGVWAGIAEAL